MTKCDCTQDLVQQSLFYPQAGENQGIFLRTAGKSVVGGWKQALEKLADFADAYMHRPEPVLLSGGGQILILPDRH